MRNSAKVTDLSHKLQNNRPISCLKVDKHVYSVEKSSVFSYETQRSPKRTVIGPKKSNSTNYRVKNAKSIHAPEKNKRSDFTTVEPFQQRKYKKRVFEKKQIRQKDKTQTPYVAQYTIKIAETSKTSKRTR